MKIASLVLFLCAATFLCRAGEPASPPNDSAYAPVIKGVEIGTGGGRVLHANIIRPEHPPAAPLPAVIWIHGGGWEGGDYQPNGAGWLAAKGYFTATIEYRLSGEAKWPAQIEDCKLAVRWLRANAAKYNVDPNRIGCAGHSAGGHLAACLGTMADLKEFEGQGGYEGVSSRVQAVVDYSGPVDFTRRDPGLAGATPTNDPPMLVKLYGGNFKSLPETWRQASPIANVNPASAPTLIIHGDQDKLVPIAQSERFAAALKKAGVPVEFIPIKGGGHSLKAENPGDPPAEPSQKELNAAVLAFFDKYLKGR